MGVGVCYRPPNQDEQANETLCKQVGEASQSLALVVMVNFNLPDVCWKYNTVDRKQSRRFLECVEGNFLTQLLPSTFQKADFGLFRSLVDRVPWKTVQVGKGVQEGWTLFKEKVLKVQEQAVPMC